MTKHVRLQGDTFGDTPYRESKLFDAGALFAPGASSYRYALWRNWETELVPAPKRILWICLNPSTADETQLDPSVRRMVRFSRDWGYGGMYLVNLFAWRSTDPHALGNVDDPVGPGNDRVTADLAERCDDVLCAWGAHGTLLDRDRQVVALLERTAAPLWLLERTKHGHPKHPLYVASERKPQKFVEAARIPAKKR